MMNPPSSNLLSTVYGFLATIVLLMIVSWLIVIGEISLYGIFVGQTEARDKSRQILFQQLSTIPKAGVASKVMITIQWFEKAGEHVNAYYQSLLHHAHKAISNGPLRTRLDMAGELLFSAGENVSISLAIIAIRVLLLVFFIPLLIIALLVGVIDGLVQRDIRRFGAGRESTLLFHRTKAIFMPSVYILSLLFLISPIAVSPALFILLIASVMGLLVSIMMSRFKKYV
ncbi:MAG: hypothetical protein CMF50_03500 [Legionellales bacterium]|nr:hypothetical protein [Legionellales bacterium]|tara:strand:+ start:3038 stop:3721 length:684 start_codon:yes stop_codon:yes gene_type:complete